ncbi:MAG: PEP-utilizing enzyme [Patescibacteria group bacterium]
MKPQKINLIFTRDFDQWIQEIIRNSLVIDTLRIWGRGLSDQIVHFDGATFHWYRFYDDMDKLRNFLVRQPLSHPIFSPKVQSEFLKLVKELRAAIKVPVSKIKNQAAHLALLTNLFERMYPYYPLGIFIAGPWREDFLKIHGVKGKPVLKLLMHSREQSEGLLKLVGLYLRAWLGPLLKKAKYPEEYVRLLTVREIKNFVERQKLPALSVLHRRARGYIYSDGKIGRDTSFAKFLTRRRLLVANAAQIDKAEIIKGVTACTGAVVTGRVKKIYNSFGVKDFKTGQILVTPMTSPEYISAMKKAAAIVTDEGGLTCHAAIVARELKKPCLIGTKIATKVLNDGDLVEVAAGRGVVKTIKRAADR